ncbi:MAG: ATP-dependent helicase, partial [Chroococcidiopsidaceae cyanobacterium CP_BM_ER_R8_30]|nr:ATP-dependent helicase [Chroococcidiopsidaceae cyanobacterium CP_BM_ER_R8_30]
MAVLHGSWILKPESGYLFIWGETWRQLTIAESSPDVPIHPLAMTQIELVEWLQAQNISISQSVNRVQQAGVVNEAERDRTKCLYQVISLPTHILENKNTKQLSFYPVHSRGKLQDLSPSQVELLSNTRLGDSSVYLQPWRVEGLCLAPAVAMKFLLQVPLGLDSLDDGFWGGDLRFWSQIARWSLDLLSRCKFLPTLHHEVDGSVMANWRVLLESAVDSSRWDKFAQVMPIACRTYQPEMGRWSVDLPIPPQELLLGFLDSTIDAQVRAEMNTHPLPAFPSPVQEWLQALGKSEAGGTTLSPTANPSKELERLETILNAWTAPLQHQLTLLEKLFRTCF